MRCCSRQPVSAERCDDIARDEQRLPIGLHLRIIPFLLSGWLGGFRSFVTGYALAGPSMPRILERARTRVSESSCGICGIDSVADGLAPLDPVEAAPPRVDPAAIHVALSAMRDHQQVGSATGTVHATAFCSYDGQIVLLSEDVGRHNALDKLIGALVRQSIDSQEGFALLSARCSQELVKKTVRARIPMLVAISAPSSLAIARAREGKLTLLALARSGSALIVNEPHHLF